MKRLIGRPEGEQLRPLRYANTWIAALDPSGTVVYVDPDKVQLDQVDLAHFAERDPQQVGDFWAEWTLDDEDLMFRRRRGDQQPKVLCPSCGVRQKVTGKGRLQIHLGRDMPSDGSGDRRCVGSGLLARVDVPGISQAVPRRERKRHGGDSQQQQVDGDDGGGEPVDLTGSDAPT